MHISISFTSFIIIFHSSGKILDVFPQHGNHVQPIKSSDNAFLSSLLLIKHFPSLLKLINFSYSLIFQYPTPLPTLNPLPLLFAKRWKTEHFLLRHKIFFRLSMVIDFERKRWKGGGSGWFVLGGSLMSK